MRLKLKEAGAKVTNCLPHCFAVPPRLFLGFCGGVLLLLSWLAGSEAPAQATNYVLGTSALLVGPAPGTNSVVLAVTPETGVWAATANVKWLHLSPANQSGTGSTNVVFSYDANAGATRFNTLTIAGQTLTVTQAGSTYVAAGTVTSLVSSGLSSPYGVAVDSAGNVYIADYYDNAIKEWTVANNTVTSLVSSGLSTPVGVAVDAVGNVYIADTGNSAVKEWMAAKNTVTNLVSSGLSGPFGVAVDRVGNVYIADTGNDAVKEWRAANQTVTNLVSLGLGQPNSVAVDFAGNVYIGDFNANAIEEWTAANKTLTTLASGLNGADGVAVDGAGLVYVADFLDNTIKTWTAVGSNVNTLASSGLNHPADVAVDGAGNVYIADSYNGAIKELPRAFVDPTDRLEGLAAGADSLPSVLPATVNLLAPFAPASDQSWLTITGVANGVVSFSFTASSSNRTANITLLGQSIPVTQGGPSYYLATNALREGPSAGSDSVVLAVAPNSATWTATANATWLHLSLANQSGTGSTIVFFSFDANFGDMRTGTLTIAGQTLSVTQAGAFTLGTYALLEGPMAGTDSVVLAALPNADPWAAIANASWLHLSPANQSGTGSTNLVFSFDANPGATRSGTLTIGGQPLTVTQAGSTYVPAGLLTTLQSVGPGPDSVAVDGMGNLYVGAFYLGGNLFPYGAVYERTEANDTMTTLFSAEYYGLHGLAVDGAENVYFSSYYDGGVTSGINKWTAHTGAITSLFYGEVYVPVGVAVDGGGNVYIADNGDSAVKEWLAASSNLITLVSNGLNSPQGVAMDAAGNVYIADTGNNAIKEWTAVNSNVIVLVSSGLSSPQGIAADGSGNLYIADTGNNAIKKWTAGTDAVSIMVAGLSQPVGLAVDLSGNVYVVENNAYAGSPEPGNGDVKELVQAFVDPSLRLESLAAGSDALPVVLPSTQNLLGPLAPVSHEPWLTITGITNGVVSFSFSAAASNRTGYISVLGQTIPVAQGAEAFAYSLGTSALLEGPTAGSDTVVFGVNPYFGAWTATANATWLHLSPLNQSGGGSTNVVFSFDANPGATRSGTLTIAGQTLTVTQAGSTYVPAGSVTTLVSSGLSSPFGVAVDGAGNVYIADYGNNAVKEWTAINNTVTTLVSSGLSSPVGVAVDGAGNVYIADTGNSAVKKWTANNNTVSFLISSGLWAPLGVTVDAAGNVYIADTSHVAVKEWTEANNSVTTLVSSGLGQPNGLAVDAAGNVYIGDFSYSAIEEWTAANFTLSTLVSAGLNEADGVAVDGAGNVYVSGYGDSTIKKWTAANNHVTTMVSSGLYNPGAVAVDGMGNVYIADSFNNAIKELPRAFVDPTPRSEGALAGNDALPAVLPATENLFAPFAPTSDQAWLAVSGVTNGVVSYSFTGTTSNRTAHITVLGQSIPVTQGTAIYSFSTNAFLEGPIADSDSVFLEVNPDTATWTATANATWLHLSLANQSGVGSTNLVFSFDSNPGPMRSGTITIAGQTLTVTQAAAFALLGANVLLEGPKAGSDSVVLAATSSATAWAATANTTWLHLSPANQSGTGSTNLVFSFDANRGATRSGSLTIGSQTLAVTQAGSTYVAAGTVTTLVSSGLNAPYGVAANSVGNVYIADTFNSAIKQWTAANNTVTTLVSAGLNTPCGVAADRAGNVYFADTYNQAIKEWTAANTTVTTLVSSGLDFPIGVTLDRAGNAYFADSANNAIKQWTAANGNVTALVSAGLSYPGGVAVDAAGNVYIADTSHNAIKQWTAAGSNVTALVSSGLSDPFDVAVDGAGNVYIADTGNNGIKKWTAQNNTVTPLVSAGLSYPYGVAVDAAGHVYIADTDNQAIKELPHAFVDPTARLESLAAGNDSLPVVLPATENLLAPFAPTSDQPWLTISGITNGVVSFSFAAATSNRTANITVLGQTVPVTQVVIGVPPTLNSLRMPAKGVLQFAFTNNPSATFTVLSATNLELPLSNWAVVGLASNTVSDLFQFTSQPTTNDPQRFYRVLSP